MGERRKSREGEKEKELKNEMFCRMMGRSRSWEHGFCSQVLRFGRFAVYGMRIVGLGGRGKVLVYRINVLLEGCQVLEKDAALFVGGPVLRLHSIGRCLRVFGEW